MRTLYNYFRSSASYRVRIAMHLKGLPYEYRPVHLNRDGGQQFGADFARLNPQRLVPVLDDGIVITQSLAILEYLEERYPEHPLLPEDADDRAYVRSLALHLACDVHPLGNLRVLKYLTGPMRLSEEHKTQWIRHWIGTGLQALEETVSQSRMKGRFCFEDDPTIADCCLVPQWFSAQRFGVDLSGYPTLRAIVDACEALEAFQAAHPAVQPDSE